MTETLRAEFVDWMCSQEEQCKIPTLEQAFQAGRESASKGEGQVTAREWMRQTGEHGTELRSLVGEELWNQILCDMDEFAETRRTPDCESDTGFGDFPKGRARFEHAPSSPGSESKFREALTVLAGCMPPRIYVIDETWSSEEPETEEGTEEAFVVIDFEKLLSGVPSSPGSEREAEKRVSIEHGPCPKCHHVHPVGAVTLAYAYTRCTYSGPGPMETCNCNFPIDDFVNEEGS